MLFTHPSNIVKTKRVVQHQLHGCLLLIWFLTTFVLAWFARPLATISLFGWPFSFYMAAQGSLLFYLLIIVFYAWWMNGVDKIDSSEVGK